MSQILITGGSSGGASDDCTALKSDIPKGLKAVTKDSDDEIIEGTLELTGSTNADDVLEGKTFYNTDIHKKETGTLKLTGNTQTAHVLNGETFYTTDPKNKLTGTMSVNSILSFNVAAYSGRRITATWTNPNQAAGKPYSGVIIRYATDGYPNKNSGTQIYKGIGNNSNSGGTSQVWIDLPNINTTYYFICYPYVVTSIGELTGNELRSTTTTQSMQQITVTGTQNITVPVGYTSVDIFCVGGGGHGGYGIARDRVGSGGGGGGAGYTKTVYNIAVSTGQILSCAVGSGGIGHNSSYGSDGGTSTVSINGLIICSAAGGKGGQDGYQPNSTSNQRYGRGGSGGSGGGSGADYDSRYNETEQPGNGGADGSNGGAGFHGPGIGQGGTTRAFGETWNTIYAGGGAGGGIVGRTAQALGGSGGGANGGMEYNGGSGSANTGGGGGGGGSRGVYNSVWQSSWDGGNGGSGIILIRFK